VLAVPYTEAPHVVRQYSDQLSGIVIVDPTNPVDFSIV
jgi:predicted dinucleotide-binding enzyme